MILIILNKNKKINFFKNFILNFFHQKIFKNKNSYIFSSKSHSKNYVFYWFSKEKLGVDMEFLKPRSKDFLEIFSKNEYEIIWGKSLENFYLMWTAKESIIKYVNGNLDDMWKIFLKKFWKRNIKISKMNFLYEAEYIFWENIFLVYSHIEGEKIYSLCFKKYKNVKYFAKF